MTKQTFRLAYADEEEEESIRWFRESGLFAKFKKLNEERVKVSGIAGSPEEASLPGVMEAIRAFFIRLSRR